MLCRRETASLEKAVRRGASRYQPFLHGTRNGNNIRIEAEPVDSDRTGSQHILHEYFGTNYTGADRRAYNAGVYTQRIGDLAFGTSIGLLLGGAALQAAQQYFF